MGEDTYVELGWPADIADPLQVEVRAMLMLKLAQQGLRDMHDTDDPEGSFYRIMLGFFAVVIFGRAVTNALQNLKTFDKQALEDWYAPWQAEMRADPLCRFFYKLRTEILKDVIPVIGVAMPISGLPVDRLYRPGSVDLGDDRPLPTRHLGEPIADQDMRHLAGLYIAYLERMVESAKPVIAVVQARWRSDHPWQPT